MKDVAIVSGVRTPFARANKGGFKDTRPDTLATIVIEEAVKRSKVEPGEIGDVILGCAMPEAEQGMNVARIAALAAGLDRREGFLVAGQGESVGLLATDAVALSDALGG